MLGVGLKEWAIVCDLLLEGRLALLLRKGGIHERGGPGVFELEHPRFLLYPSWAHQKPEMIKPEHRDRVQVRDEPTEITFHGLGEAAKIWRVTERSVFLPGGALEPLHCWTEAQIHMRFDYKPENPLYLMAVRVSRLAAPVTVAHNWRYAGCKSWVPLREEHAVDDSGARAVIGDEAFEKLVRRVGDAVG